MKFAAKTVATVFLCLNLEMSSALPATAYENCEGIPGPAHFSLYKNRRAIFSSVANADYEQKYAVEWFFGSKSLGSITKKSGESFVLRGSNLSSRAFSVTGSYKKNGRWFISHYKIFPGSKGAIQIRFEDGTCDNSFETSPDLKVIININ